MNAAIPLENTKNRKIYAVSLVGNLTYKIVDNANFLNLFAVYNLNRADVDFINQPIQNYLVQLRDGRISVSLSCHPSFSRWWTKRNWH